MIRTTKGGFAFRFLGDATAVLATWQFSLIVARFAGTKQEISES
jgi:hypothetical protein